MTLGEIVWEYRELNNMTMEDFAKKSGLSKGYISMLEKNLNPRNKKPIAPSLLTIRQVSEAISMEIDDVIELIGGDQYITVGIEKEIGKAIKIPVLGKVAAGIPFEAIEDIVDYEEISEHMASTGDYFGLKIKGNSMEPRIAEGDVLIIKKQSDIESGCIAIVMVNGDDATCKKVVKHDNGISLIPFNPVYAPKFYTCEEILSKPITIIGRVVENRQKY